MKINVSENDNLIEIIFSNKKYIFYKNTINCIFFDFKNIDFLLNFEIKDSSKYDVLYSQYKYKLIFTFGYHGSQETINFFQKYNSSFIKFTPLEFFWYMVLENNCIYEEKILPNLHKNYDIIINQDIKKYFNLQTEIQKIEEDVLEFKIEINTNNLEEVENRKQNLVNNFESLNNFIDKFKIQFDSLFKILNDKIYFLQNLEKKKDKHVHVNIKNNDTKKIEFKNEYLGKLQNYIDDVEMKKKKSLQSLIQVNDLVSQKKIALQKMEEELFNIKREKKQMYELKLNSQKSMDDLNNISRNIPKNNIKNGTNHKIAVMIHFFNIRIYDEIYNYISRLNSCNINFDLYINLAVNETSDLEKGHIKAFIQKINSQKLTSNFYFTVSDNRGMDIGGFIQSYLKMLEMNLKYDSIIKIHSKTNNNWRFAMLYALLGNNNIIKNNLQLIQRKDVGMIGNQTLSLKYLSKPHLIQLLKYYMKLYDINKFGGEFIPGTIFWIKGCILQKYFTSEKLLTCYNQFKQNYCGIHHNRVEGKPHAFERLFGLLVENYGLKTIRFDI